jgi:serine/threonine protein kinase
MVFVWLFVLIVFSPVVEWHSVAVSMAQPVSRSRTGPLLRPMKPHDVYNPRGVIMTLAAGTRFGPYEIVSLIAAGGMGEVYRVRDTRLEHTVAIKLLSSHLCADPEANQRFKREGRTISSLNHPNICQLYDVGEQNGINYLVMEYLEGETLAKRLQKSGQKSWLTPGMYTQKIQPLLVQVSTSAIASRIGVSRWYAGKIRQGYRPHPRHWQALAQLVSVSPNA